MRLYFHGKHKPYYLVLYYLMIFQVLLFYGHHQCVVLQVLFWSSISLCLFPDIINSADHIPSTEEDGLILLYYNCICCVV